MEMAVEKRYVLAGFLLEPGKRLLTRHGQRVHLANRPFQVLLYLIEHRGRLVTRHELLDRYWSGQDVYDETLTKSVGAIRKALDDQSEHPRFIETRWAEGYRYIGPLEELGVETQPAVVEIEKVREVKIIVEEEEVEEPVAESETVSAPQARLRPSAVAEARPSVWAVLGVAGLAAIALVGSPLLLSRPGGSLGEPPTSPVRSVAVLPLKNLTGDAEKEYLSDGLTDSLITALSRVPGLKVTSQASVFRFKGKDTDPREIGRLLSVAAVLEGSVRQSGQLLRVETRLASTEDGRVLWASDSYDRPWQDVFALQDEIARGTVVGLRLRLDGVEEQRLVRRHTANVDAYQGYVRGRFFVGKRNEPALKTAIQHFEHAINRDPAYALAYAGLADAYALLGFVRSLPLHEGMRKAEAAAVKALEIDDTLAEAHASLAAIKQFRTDWSGAEREFTRAIELNPGYVTARHWYALYLAALGRLQEAIIEIEHALDLDPLSLIVNTDVGAILCFARQDDRAITQLRKTVEMDPAFGLAHHWLGLAYEQNGLLEEAVAELKQAVTLSGGSPPSVAALGHAYAASNQRSEAQKVLRELDGAAQLRYVSSYDRAVVLTGLGEHDRALEWLEKTYHEDVSLLAFLKVDSVFDGVRPDPRFRDLVRRIGLPP